MLVVPDVRVRRGMLYCEVCWSIQITVRSMQYAQSFV